MRLTGGLGRVGSGTNIERAGIAVASMILALSLIECSEPVEQPRPPGVSLTATLIHAPKGAGVWQECRLENDGVRCKIANRKGLVIYDERFAVYSGHAPREISDLKISSQGGEQWVLLANGTILIPTSDEASMRRFLDWTFGKRATR
jgi:hypothetical protein